MADENKQQKPRLTFEERQEKKINLAHERDSRVQIVRVPDTHMVMDICNSADKALKILRNGLFVRYRVEDVAPLMEDWHKMLIDLHHITERLCTAAGVKNYRAPRTLLLDDATSTTQQVAALQGASEIATP